MGRARRRPRDRAARTGRGRWTARAAMLLGLVVLALGVLAPSADANYARIEASVGCDRVVSWSASASTGSGDAERVNARVRVEYRPEGLSVAEGPLDGSTGWRSAGPDGRFEASNDFRFEGFFELPDGVDAVQLRVVPLGSWGARSDGSDPGEPRFTRAELPRACASHPVVAAASTDCDAGAVLIELRNLGASPQTVGVALDGLLLREVPVSQRAERLAVPLLSGTPSRLRLTADRFVLVERDVGAECPADRPHAVVLERCGPGDAVVLAHGGEDSAEARIRVAGALVHTTTIRGGTVLQRTLELPPGTTPVEVSLDGSVVVSGTVGSCDGPEAGLLRCTGDCSVAATLPEPPPPPPPPLTLELDPATGLPVTGPWQRAVVLLLGGGLLALGGAALSAGERRRPVSSPLAHAVAAYRRPWWDDR